MGKIESLRVLLKAFVNKQISRDTLIKAISASSGLVPKKITIMREGKSYQAIRWVKTGTDESEEKIKTKEKVSGDSDIDRVSNILSSSKNMKDKCRDLVNEGVYDKSTLCLLTGISGGGAREILKQGGVYEKGSKSEPTATEKAVKAKIKEEQGQPETAKNREESTFLREVPLDEVWENYERNLQRVISGRHKFALAYGTGGVGKTYTFSQLSKKNELREYDPEVQPNSDQYDYVKISGKITASQVYAEMYRHRDKLIVFDDCDSFLKMEEVQGFLKAGLDTGDDTKISNKSSKPVYNVEGDKDSGRIPNSFRFNGRVIAITNLTSQDIEQAVRSRAMLSNLSMTVNETVDRLGKIKDKIKIFTADKTEQIDVDQESRDFALDVIKEMKDKLGNDLNTRVYSNAVLMVQEGKDMGDSKERIKRDVKGMFNDVIGTVDQEIRNLQQKVKNDK
jgi:hypothetical protein